MTITVSEILLASKGLSDLKTRTMSGRLSYKIKKAKDALAPFVKNFEDTKNELIKEKYGAPKEDDPNTIEVPPAKMPAFIEEINGLLTQVETIEFNKFAADDFDTIETTPEFFDLIAKFMED